MIQNEMAILEAVLFASPEPVSVEQLQSVLGEATRESIIQNLNILKETYDSKGSGLCIIQLAGGYRMATRPDLHPWLSRLAKTRPARLSRPALETLAIIAYRQPITKAEIESVRGVMVDGVLKTLMERELIRILGRKREVGRPLLYGTTRRFLEHFGFRDLTELPSPQEIEALTPVSREAGGIVEAKEENA